ncbi:hypothetical protein [Sulfurimonas sp.]|uniref:hypothetical protein n=1 Tax=Sulfurimonas sp. TaxID=2022749 RepID=UPI003563F26D
MAQLLKTIDEYVTNVRKKTTMWIVFNTIYNDVHAFNKKLNPNELNKYLKKEYTDLEEQKNFLDFMSTEFPDTVIEQVFDLASANYLMYPYLGSYVIDTNIGSDVYNALAEKYGDPYQDPVKNNAVLWVIEYEEAQKFHKDREEMVDSEF